MSSPSRMHRVCVFLTPTDEVAFTRELRRTVPAARFVNMADQDATGSPRFREAMDECAGAHVTIVDSSIVSEQEFGDRYVRAHPAGESWIYGIAGSGLANLLRSRAVDDGLMNGELRATVPAGDDRTEQYVRSLMTTLRTGAEPVFAVDPATGQLAKRGERNFLAWPDAAARFGRLDDPRLVNAPTARFGTRPRE